MIMHNYHVEQFHLSNAAHPDDTYEAEWECYVRNLADEGLFDLPHDAHIWTYYNRRVLSMLDYDDFDGLFDLPF